MPHHCLQIIDFKIDCEDIFNHINIDDNNFMSHYQRVVILQELQKLFGLLYIGEKKQ